MDEWEKPRERAEWTHPRRAAKEIISYLSQVEPVIDQFAQDDHSYGGGGDEDEDEDVGREQMMDNILEELKHQTASIMEDRQGSVVAEKIARRLTPVQLRTMLSRCRGYMLSLANNRYSSHVLQTLLSVVGQVVEAEISGDEEEDEEGQDHGHDTAPQDAGGGKVDSLQDIVLSLVSELSGAWAELLADISGSHVGRGFLQVLGGLPILSEKRGKQSRHAHSIGTAVAPGRMAARDGSKSRATTAAVDAEALEKWSTPYRHRVPPLFVKALGEITSELAALPASELQTLACGTYGCPLLVMLLRVHGNLAVATAADDEEKMMMLLPCLEQESAAMKIVMKVLEWDDEERSAQVVYAISGENTASHFLEAVLWLSPRKFFEELYHRCFESKLLEFCEHGVSNFLIQAALQRADDRALAEKMVEAISDNAADLLRARRAGVLWRAAQACVRLDLKAKTQSKLLEDIALAVHAGHTGAAHTSPQSTTTSTEADDGKGGDGKQPSPPPVADAFKAARAWVPALLSPRLPGEGGLDRLFLNVPGARIVQNALLFDPPVAAPVLKAVAALPEDLLAAIARDNMGSRCLLDPILEAAGGKAGGGGKGKGKDKNKPAEDARRAILRAFRGHLVAMACDRVAWHILLKCFRGVDMKEKRAMTEELAGAGEQAWSRMSGYPSGRSVLTECMVERFSRSPREWEDAFKNRDNRAKMLTEILAVESSSSTKQGEGKGKGREGGKSGAAGGGGGASGDGGRRAAGLGLAPSPFNTASGSQADGDDGGQGKGKEKRRRQRGRGKRGKSSTAADAGAAVDGDVGVGGTAADELDSNDVPGIAVKAAAPKGQKSSKETPKEGGPGAHAGKMDTVGGVGDDDGAASKNKKKKKRKSQKPKQEGGADVAVSDENGGGKATSGSPGAISEVPEKKMKKRKRQENGSGLDGVSGGGDSKDKQADASVANKEPLPAVAGEVQAPVSTVTKKNQKGNKDKDKDKAFSGGGEGDGHGQDAGTALLPTVANNEEESGTKQAKKKRKKEKESKIPPEETGGSKWKAMETPSKQKGEGIQVGSAQQSKAAASSSSGKKRKGGFRLF